MIRVTVTTEYQEIEVDSYDFDDWDVAFSFIARVARSDATCYAEAGAVPWKSRSFDVSQVPA